MKNPHGRNDRWYIDGMLAEAGLPDPEPGDEVVFEMPPFCSSDYSAPIHFDEHGVPYILRKESYLPGCRDWSIRRNHLNRQAQHHSD